MILLVLYVIRILEWPIVLIHLSTWFFESTKQIVLLFVYTFWAFISSAYVLVLFPHNSISSIFFGSIYSSLFFFAYQMLCLTKLRGTQCVQSNALYLFGKQRNIHFKNNCCFYLKIRISNKTLKPKYFNIIMIFTKQNTVQCDSIRKNG